VLKISVVAFVMLFCVLFLVASSPVIAQVDPLELQWSQTYDNYLDASMIQTLDGGFLIAGANTTSSQRYLTLVKINSAGEVEWSKVFPEITWFPTFMRTVDSGYILFYDGLSVGVVYLLNVDFQGKIVESRQLFLGASAAFSQSVRDLSVAKDGSYVMAIFESHTKGGGYSSRLVCYNVVDVVLWEKRFEQVSVDVVLQFDSGDGGYFVAGSQDKQPWFAKLDLDGKVVWSSTYGFGSPLGWSSVCSVVLVSDGSFLFGGVSPSYDGVGFVVKVNGEGLVQWGRKYEGPVYGVIKVGTGQFLVFSTVEVICLSGSGGVLWVEPYSNYVEEFGSLANVYGLRSSVFAFVDKDGGVVVAVPYGVSGVHTFCLWVARFTVESLSSSSVDNDWVFVLLFGVVVVVVVVFVGFLVCYSKKRKYHRVIVA